MDRQAWAVVVVAEGVVIGTGSSPGRDEKKKRKVRERKWKRREDGGN